MSMNDITAEPNVRLVSIPLAFGVLLLPVVFAWFLLRRGYSSTSRVIGFGWTAVVTMPIVIAAMTPGLHKTDGVDLPEIAHGSGWDDDGSATWRYDERTDEMRGSTDRRARLESQNSLDFKFPYNGGSTGLLEVRQTRASGLNVILRISKGQFMCHQFTDPTVLVKFDSGPIEKFRCVMTCSPLAPAL